MLAPLQMAKATRFRKKPNISCILVLSVLLWDRHRLFSVKDRWGEFGGEFREGKTKSQFHLTLLKGWIKVKGESGTVKVGSPKFLWERRVVVVNKVFLHFDGFLVSKGRLMFASFCDKELDSDLQLDPSGLFQNLFLLLVHTLWANVFVFRIRRVLLLS